jgi:hypothetical protein
MTQAKRLADTVFFKHKYITQPTITPANVIVNAYNKLQQAIQGLQLQHSKDDAHFEALERIKNIMLPTTSMQSNRQKM